MPEVNVTVLIVARNEAHNLRGCLASVAWAGERVVVVDPASADNTLEIALEEADITLVRTFDNFANQRNAALAVASGDWVLSIDADERVTAALGAEIRRVIADQATTAAGFRVPIRSEILGRQFGYSGTQHDLPVRLFRRERGRWVGLVHETVDLDGTVGTLRHELTHTTLPTIQVFLSKVNDYTTLEARQLASSPRPYRALDLTVRPLWTFLKLYVFKQGFRDGVEGFVFCALSGVSVAVRAWKHRELTLSLGRAS